MRQSVGFDRFNDLFESLVNEKETRFEAYPPYNIEKVEDDLYRIEIALSGFTEADIDIVVHDDTLKVTAARNEESSDKTKTYLHKGIAMRSFERSFRLADHIKVMDASLEHGLLTIVLEREVPEEKKPRMIPINAKSEGYVLSKKKKK